jgi:sulfate adenylyltransferase subunit 2
MTTIEQYGFDQPQVWSTELAHQKIEASGDPTTKRTTERQLQTLDFLPAVLTAETLQDEHTKPPTPTVLDWQIETARRARKLVLFIQLKALPNGTACLHANDARGARYWLPLPRFAHSTIQDLNNLENVKQLKDALQQLQQFLTKELAVFPHAEITTLCRAIEANATHTNAAIQLCMLGYAPVLDLAAQHNQAHQATGFEQKTLRTSQASTFCVRLLPKLKTQS